MSSTQSKSDRLRNAGEAIGDIARKCGEFSDQKKAEKFVKEKFDIAAKECGIIHDFIKKCPYDLKMSEEIDIHVWISIKKYKENPDSPQVHRHYIKHIAEFIVGGKEFSGEFYEEKRQWY
ncbi:hypothetical protein ACFL02_06380, partial [Planctomycetota bacterium]